MENHSQLIKHNPGITGGGEGWREGGGEGGGRGWGGNYPSYAANICANFFPVAQKAYE